MPNYLWRVMITTSHSGKKCTSLQRFVIFTVEWTLSSCVANQIKQRSYLIHSYACQ